MVKQSLPDFITTHIHPESQPTFIAVGFFMGEFSGIEMRLTAFLAKLAEAKSIDTFHIITSGMDARVKLERFYKLVRELVAPNLLERLDYFQKTLIKTRNQLAHSGFWKNTKNPELLHCLTIKDLSPFSDVSHDDVELRFNLRQLVIQARWMGKFSKDLTRVYALVGTGKTLEIENPKSVPPQELRDILQALISK
ncbi:MAG: hypothetical protein ABJA10_02930 [Aestuariivirga sp.]